MSESAAAPVRYAVFIRRPTSTRFVQLSTGAVCPAPEEIAAQVEAGVRVAAVVREYRGDVPVPARVSSWQTDPGRTALACTVVGAKTDAKAETRARTRER